MGNQGLEVKGVQQAAGEQVTYNRFDKEPCTELKCHQQEEQEHLHR